MMQPWIMNQVAKERQREYLKEAKGYKISAQIRAGRSSGKGQLARIKAGFRDLVFVPWKTTVSQGR